MLGGHTGSLGVQPKISTSRSAWLSHGGGRKKRILKGMWHLQSAQLPGRGAEELAPRDTSHARGLEAEENPLPTWQGVTHLQQNPQRHFIKCRAFVSMWQHPEHGWGVRSWDVCCTERSWWGEGATTWALTSPEQSEKDIWINSELLLCYREQRERLPCMQHKLRSFFKSFCMGAG